MSSRRWKALSLLGSAFALAVPSLGYGADPAPAPGTPAPAASEAPAPIEYGNELMKNAGLDALNLKLYGWVQASYTYNHASPHDRINNFRTFDVRSNDFALNQVAVNLERPLAQGEGFDVGGKIELMYGADGRFIHSNGLADNISGDIDSPITGDTLNFDPVQFYGLIRLPVGTGLTVKVGKYVTPFGYEVIDAGGNPFYSHSFLFGYAIPFTHTGLQLDYQLTEKLGVYYGLTLGWDQFNDRNGTLSHMVGGSYKATDAVTIYANVVTGPERDWENTDYRTVFDSTVAWKVNDTLTLAINGDFGNESGTGNDLRTGNNWYGFAAYAIITLVPDQLNLNLRGEYFRDESGSRMGFTSEMMELTAGLDIHPFKNFYNLRLRPEVRWDHAFGDGDSPFDTGFDATGGDKDQITVGMDVIISF